MTPREVVQAAFRFEETDTVPYAVYMEPEVEQGLDAHYGSPAWRDKLVKYMFGSAAGLEGEDLGDGTRRDPFGLVTALDNIMDVRSVPLQEPSLKGYQWPEPEAVGDWDNLAAIVEAEPGSFRFCGIIYGLFERAWSMRGFENFLVDMIESPDFVNELLDRILDIHLEVIDIVASRIPVDTFFGTDDWAGQRAPLMSLELWRQYFPHRLATLIERAHDRGVSFMLHSCGNVMPFIDDLLDIGLDALESLQPEAMDVYELKQRTKGRLVLIGGLGSQSILPFGTPEEVRDETRRLIREMGRGGGYILGPSKPLTADVPTENVAAFLETAWDQ